MDKKLQDKLYTKYPKIFRQKDLSCQQTAMCWGFDCGNGWYNLIDYLCDYIQYYLENSPEVPQVEATQVKEKYGGLRFYFEGGNNKIHEWVDFATGFSYRICEECGSMENVSQTKGWIVTLCKKCQRKREIKGE